MKKASAVWLVLIQWVIALEWLHANWSKWSGPDFISNINLTLQGFAAKTSYSFYSSFLKSVAIPNAELFGNAIRLGELGVGLALIIGGVFLLKFNKLRMPYIGIIIAACFAGALMNLNFFLATSWTGPSAAGLNLVMGLIELILGIYYITNRNELSTNN
jgi:thiosulfate dehydrogenase [quinone] large subunit